MLLFLAFLLALARGNTCNGFSEWTQWTPTKVDATALPQTHCKGRCGTGELTTKRTRTCCLGTGLCEGDLSEEQNWGDCVLPEACKDESDRRQYDGFVCNDREYLGTAGSAGTCQDLEKNSTTAYDGYMLECYGDNTEQQVACYGCKAEELSESSCGSQVYLEFKYDWNYALTGMGFGVAFLVIVGSAITHSMYPPSEEEERPHKDDDPLDIDPGDGLLCSCCPAWFDLATGTTAMCFTGFAMGALLNIAFDGASAKQKSDWLELIYYPGELWINALKMIVVPMIALMMLSLPDRVDLLKSSIGTHLFGFYVFTSAIAACEGLFWVNIIRPGDVDLFITPADKSVDSSLTELDALLGIGRKAIPNNIVGAMASGNILGVITFFLTLGIFIQTEHVPKKWSKVIMDATKASLKAIMLMIPYLIKITPIAMFCIVTNKIASVDNLQLLLQTEAYYLLTAILGQGVHAMIFYPLLCFAATKGGLNGWSYFNKVRGAPFTAFATSSSAATLPTTTRYTREAGIHPSIVDFIAPIGSAINMDGTSLGFPIMVLFTAQLVDEKLDAGTQITIALLAMTCSIGTAPIPNAGLVYITMLFTAAGGKLAEDDVIALGLAMIVVFDWFVDRVETAQNVWSDCVACALFDHFKYQDELERIQLMTERSEEGGHEMGELQVKKGGDGEKRSPGNEDYE